jgi:hypothetical protein
VNIVGQSGLLMLICSLTLCILEVSWGEVSEIILATICDSFAKSPCAYTYRKKVLFHNETILQGSKGAHF